MTVPLPEAEPVREDDLNKAIRVGNEQTSQVALKPVPKSWKPVIASKADGSPVVIYVSPKIHDAIVAADPKVLPPEPPEDVEPTLPESAVPGEQLEVPES